MELSRLRRSHAGGLYWGSFHAALWALLAEGRGWALGIPLVLLATSLALWLGTAPVRLHLPALPGFVAFFTWHMLQGGWDVARRALHPRLPLAPAWRDYPLACSEPRVRLLLSALVGLLPGTLASEVEGDCLRMHLLDHEQPWQATVAELERHLARLLGAGAG
ncbi:Na+/H+ antiporter subunit E [Azotobacter salinestris]|uniref:Na+/H+ antiporter subunit E n=1 Tax=Azotobacter salinestris TaxID=69964 RepID=UPI001266A74E|nr:Na+/H+ antiporter subunit E [Azotobacter salinestris]